ncbi:hypothetical protein HK405_012527, partial [Cladochytrium tenue]
MAASSGPPIVANSTQKTVNARRTTALPLAAYSLKDVVIVTSRGTFIVKCDEEATVAWALNAATDLMMESAAARAKALGETEESERDPLVAARTADGSVARDEERIFDVCKENK